MVSILYTNHRRFQKHWQLHIQSEFYVRILGNYTLANDGRYFVPKHLKLNGKFQIEMLKYFDGRHIKKILWDIQLNKCM